MAQNTPSNSGQVTPDDLMRYLDGELSPEDRSRVEAEAARSTELQREIAMYRSLKADVQGLSFHPATHGSSVWDGVNQRVNRPIGMGLILIGLVVWMAYGAYVFATSSVSAWEKLATAAIAIGVLQLLASVIWDRYREFQTDPYKDVQR